MLRTARYRYVSLCRKADTNVQAFHLSKAKRSSKRWRNSFRRLTRLRKWTTSFFPPVLAVIKMDSLAEVWSPYQLTVLIPFQPWKTGDWSRTRQTISLTKNTPVRKQKYIWWPKSLTKCLTNGLATSWARNGECIAQFFQSIVIDMVGIEISE